MNNDLRSTLQVIRHQFETQQMDVLLLKKLYTSYCPCVPNIDLFFLRARGLFPRLNCGIASLYIQHVIQRGTIIGGSFMGQPHSFLLLPDNIVADITADQFGGPQIFVGPLVFPWRKK